MEVSHQQFQQHTTSGFSIVSYTGTGANATVGHGLGVTPKMMIVKKSYYCKKIGHVYHQAIYPATKYLLLNSTGAEGTSKSQFGMTLAPTSSVFSSRYW
jgi:hypothetical protein